MDAFEKFMIKIQWLGGKSKTFKANQFPKTALSCRLLFYEDQDFHSAVVFSVHGSNADRMGAG